MHTFNGLQAQLLSLEAERSQLTSEGWYLQNCWLVQVKPGGTARTGRQYWQVRSRQAVIDGNKKLKHLKPEEVDDYKAAIARGRQLKQIDYQIELLQQQLSQLFVPTGQARMSSQLSQIDGQTSTFSVGNQIAESELAGHASTQFEPRDISSELLIAQSKQLRFLLQQSCARSKKLVKTMLQLKERRLLIMQQKDFFSMCTE